MDREKQIEEKHELSESIYMSGHGLDWEDSDDIAEQLYNAGHRKQSEIAREIFEEIDNIIYNLMNSPFYSSGDAVYELTELKNKWHGG